MSQDMDVSQFMAHGFSDLMDASGSDGEGGAGEKGEKMRFEDSSEEESGVEEEAESDGEVGSDAGTQSAEEGESPDELAEGSEAEAEAEGMLDEIQDHKSQLRRLQAKDPEFFKFLAAEDRDLLAFGEDEAGSSEGEEQEQADVGEDGGEDGEGGTVAAGESEEEGDGDVASRAPSKAGKVVTKDMVGAWGEMLSSVRAWADPVGVFVVG